MSHHYAGSVPAAEPGRAWLLHAACIAEGFDPDSMFDTSRQGEEEARAVCLSCPVRRSCLRDAIATGDTEHGMRGGHTPKERRSLAAELKRRATGEPEPTTLAEALAQRTTTNGEHTLFTGKGFIYFAGERHPPLRTAFTLGHGRQPAGRVTRTCHADRCVRADHLADDQIRAAYLRRTGSSKQAAA